MRITEAALRRILREEARRTRIFEADENVDPATNVAAATDAANTVAAAGATVNPASSLDATSKGILQNGLSNLGLTGFNVDAATPQSLVTKYLEFLNVGTMNADLWFGDGQYPAQYDEAQQKKFLNYFVDKWNQNLDFAEVVDADEDNDVGDDTVDLGTVDTNELINLIDSDEAPGGLDSFDRYTGQWNDEAGLQLVRIHNAFVALKKLLPGTPNINPSSLKPQGGGAPSTPAETAKPAEPATSDAGAAAGGAAAGGAAAGGAAAGGAAAGGARQQIPVIAGVAEIQGLVGMLKDQQDGRWGKNTQIAVSNYIDTQLKGRIVIQPQDITAVQLATQWKTVGPRITSVNGTAARYPNGSAQEFLAFLKLTAQPVQSNPGGKMLSESRKRISINWGR